MAYYSEERKKTAVFVASLILSFIILVTAGVIYWKRPEMLNGLGAGLLIGVFLVTFLPGDVLARHMMIPDEEPKEVQPQPQKLIEYVTDKA